MENEHMVLPRLFLQLRAAPSLAKVQATPTAFIDLTPPAVLYENKRC
jgi:hypothetical protein